MINGMTRNLRRYALLRFLEDLLRVVTLLFVVKFLYQETVKGIRQVVSMNLHVKARWLGAGMRVHEKTIDFSSYPTWQSMVSTLVTLLLIIALITLVVDAGGKREFTTTTKLLHLYYIAFVMSGLGVFLWRFTGSGSEISVLRNSLLIPVLNIKISQMLYRRYVAIEGEALKQRIVEESHGAVLDYFGDCLSLADNSGVFWKPQLIPEYYERNQVATTWSSEQCGNRRFWLPPKEGVHVTYRIAKTPYRLVFTQGSALPGLKAVAQAKPVGGGL